MFPSFKVRIKGLDPTAKYVLLLDIVLSNENRYKYYHNQWIKSGKAEISQHLHSPFIHPDSPTTGEEWMSKSISFHKIKLSNTRVDKDDVVRFPLLSMTFFETTKANGILYTDIWTHFRYK